MVFDFLTDANQQVKMLERLGLRFASALEGFALKNQPTSRSVSSMRNKLLISIVTKEQSAHSNYYYTSDPVFMELPSLTIHCQGSRSRPPVHHPCTPAAIGRQRGPASGT